MCMIVCRKDTMKIYKLIIEYDDTTEVIEFVSEEMYDRDVEYTNEEDTEAICYCIELDSEYWDKEDIERLKGLGVLGDA